VKLQRIVSLTVPMLLIAGSAFCAASGTPLDSVANQIVQIISGPIAMMMIAGGFIGAAIIFFLGRNFEMAFVTLGALAIGGVLASQVQVFATYFFPNLSVLIG